LPRFVVAMEFEPLGLYNDIVVQEPRRSDRRFANRRACCVDHKSDDIVKMLWICWRFVVYEKLTTNRSNGVLA